LNRNQRIDFLRTIAITPVVLVHLMIIVSVWPSEPYRLIAMNGYYGVTLFFVVSGFLITENAVKRYGSLSQIDAPKFYRARASRILPALFLMMAGTLLLWACGAQDLRRPTRQSGGQSFMYWGSPRISLPLVGFFFRGGHRFGLSPSRKPFISDTLGFAGFSQLAA
jgi:peptidoglycan/LPS O-acetylase OafA/YrhL